MSDYLPQEVILNILTRLPPESLIKFRCVCKSWNSLISTPYFVSLHTSTPQPKPSTVVIRRYSKTHSSELYSLHTDDNNHFTDQENVAIENPFRHLTRYYYRIVGSCNGVLCLLNDLFGHTHSIFLWNPVIRRRVSLPPPQGTWPCMCVLGFGYDGKSNDFKVVRLAYAQVDYGYYVPPKVEVYALGEGNWRQVNGKITRSWMVDYFWTQAFVNGNVHWVGYKVKRERAQVENLIVVFDLSDEAFAEMPLPDALADDLPFNLNVAVYEETVAVFQYDARVVSKSCSVWVMKEYGNIDSWSKQFCIDLEGGLGMVLGFRRNNEVLLTTRNGGLIAYDPDTGTMVDLGILGTKDSFYACTFVGGLALLLEGEVALESKTDGECGSSEDTDDDRHGFVEKSELRKQSSMLRYLSSMIDALYM